MRYLIKPFLCILLALLCMAVIRGYSKYMKKRRLETREFLRLCEVIRKSIATRLLTPKEAFADVSCSEAAVERFRLAVVSGATLKDAFSGVIGLLSLSGNIRSQLSEYFATFGQGYLDDEVRCADEFLERFRAELEREEASGDTDERVARAIIIAITLGVIILII
jgi:hypothetical protein